MSITNTVLPVCNKLISTKTLRVKSLICVLVIWKTHMTSMFFPRNSAYRYDLYMVTKWEKNKRVLLIVYAFSTGLQSTAMKLMNDSLILSHLQFGITNWGFEWDRILNIQKRAFRIMTNSRYNAHTEPLFKQLYLLKVKDIFDAQCMKFWYKFINKKQLFPWHV